MAKRANGYWDDDDKVLAECRKYSTRWEFKRGNGYAYQVARVRNLLEQLYPSKLADWSDDATVLAEGRKYSSRAEFMRGCQSAYETARKRGLLDHLYPSKYADWSDDATVLAEGRKYASRAELMRGCSGAYLAARVRNLLDLINWPENNAPSDNDTIYIWRAVSEYFNGNPVFKIGVTSARLGDIRVKQVAKASGFNYELICCEPVQCKASKLEAELHILGENPGYTGFDGCTEFRALSASALEAALALINLNRIC